MWPIKSDIVWILLTLHVSNCERRIQGGFVLKSEKSYVVYLVKAPISKMAYDYWLCGGALVTAEYVVTSAACLMDVQFLYVIAGYNKYVVDKDIDTNPCTREKKKKVIYTCFPAKYELDYSRTDEWAQIDIGVAKVESPYDFIDESYKAICSYIPTVIPISYEAKHRETGTDAIVMGWGHKLSWRNASDTQNYNQETLNYAPVVIMDKEECKSEFNDVGNMAAVIDRYMICTQGKGVLNEFGEQIIEKKPPVRCFRRQSMAYPEESFEECEEEDGYQYDTRRKMNLSNHSIIDSKNGIMNKNVFNNKTTVTNASLMPNKTALFNRTMDNSSLNFNTTKDFNTFVKVTRRNGICQNDHGGPLVTWSGMHEVLIGVASVFKVTKDFNCTGPYLYTSTHCNGAFLDCILSNNSFEVSEKDPVNRIRRGLCRKSFRDKGYATVERHISWLYHPAGAADHEKHLRHGENIPDINKQATKADPANNVNPANNMNTENNVNPSNNMNLANKMDLKNNMNSANNMDLANSMNLANYMNPSNNMNLPNNMNPANNINPAKKWYPTVYGYALTEKPSYVIDTINERFG